MLGNTTKEAVGENAQFMQKEHDTQQTAFASEAEGQEADGVGEQQVMTTDAQAEGEEKGNEEKKEEGEEGKQEEEHYGHEDEGAEEAVGEGDEWFVAAPLTVAGASEQPSEESRTLEAHGPHTEAPRKKHRMVGQEDATNMSKGSIANGAMGP